MADPFTIRIFVPDGDPESVKIIDRMNWTGMGISFPREKWPSIKHRAEFSQTGVYILVGYAGVDDDDDLPTIYVGQGDGIRSRIDSHFQSKDFWDSAIAFVSTSSSGLNRAHITWLEYALIERANVAERSHIDNGNVPQEPALSESEKADTRAFLNEVLKILPLVNLRAFDRPRPVASPSISSEGPSTRPSGLPVTDLIIVPAKQEGFERVFLGENSRYAIRISGGMLSKVKYIAAYRSQPISAITHYAPVDHIESYGEGGKYKVVFSEPAKEIGPIPYGEAPSGAMQGPRYGSFDRLKAAKQLTDLI